MPRLEALRLLLDECLALRLKLDAGEIQALVDWIAGIECHALTFSDLHAAARLFEGVCRAPSGSISASTGPCVGHPAPV